MNTLRYIFIISTLLLAPAYALADNENSRPLMAPAPIKNLIREVRGIASSTRAEIKDDRKEFRGFASTTSENLRVMLASSTPQERVQLREDTHTALEQKRGEVRAAIDDAKNKAKEKFGEAVQASVSAIGDKLSRSIENLTNIADRIDARITALEAAGRTMDTSAALLVTARADIAAAQDKVTATGTALSTILASATPKTKMNSIKTAVKGAEDAIKTAKDSLQKTLDSLKANR